VGFTAVPVAGSAQDLSVGGAFVGRASMDAADPNLARPSGDVLRLFNSEAEFSPGLSLQAAFRAPFSRRFAVEVSAAWTHRDLQVRVSDDFEDAEDVTIAETLNQIAVGGALVAHLRPVWPRARTTPYAIGGGHFFWEFHEGDLLVSTGGQVFLGGGVDHVLRQSRSPKTRVDLLGLRVEGRLVARTGGAAFNEDDVHLFPSVGAAIFMRF
jgi:hypothetical protein